jgi:Zn-dependent M16 (insulinase) family peptidase
LPVYLEHVLFPKLSDSACYTEVHHVDGTGHDAGVVYSEMQAIQNTQSGLMDVKFNELLYPENIGYRWETGGMLAPLRVLTNERIREFHKSMYQPKNLCVIIAGEIDQDNLIDIMTAFEDSIVNDVPKLEDPFKRPWIDSIQPADIGETTITTIEFPEEDESIGEVWIGFFGPGTLDEPNCKLHWKEKLLVLTISSICYEHSDHLFVRIFGFDP